MKFKKIISAAVGAAVVCSSLPFSSATVDFVKDNIITANAEETNETTISIGNIKVSQKNIDKIVRVPVLISNSTGVAAIGMECTYDEMIESYDAEIGMVDPESNGSNGCLFITFASSEDIKEDGILCYLIFKLPETAKVGDIFNISAKPASVAFNADGENINVKTVGGSITVVDGDGDPNVSGEPVKTTPENVTYKHSNDNEIVIEVGNLEVTKDDIGKVVEVPVSIFNNTGFAHTGIKYYLDENLNFYGIKSGMVMPVKSFANGVLAATSSRSKDKKEDGVLYYLKIQLPETASIGDEYVISADLKQFVNADTEDVDAKIYGGSIIVTDSTKTTDITTSATTISSTTKTETTITTTTVTTDSKEVKLGDLNGDKNIDSKDAVLVLKSYAESLVNNNATVDLVGDINGDKKVDSKDAVIILKYYAATLTGFTGSISEFNK